MSKKSNDNDCNNNDKDECQIFYWLIQTIIKI